MKETSCHFFKMAIFSIFFGDLMTYIMREYAGKKRKLTLNVSTLKIINILLSLFKAFSLYEEFAIIGNGNNVNQLKLAGKSRETTSNEPNFGRVLGI